VASAGDFLARSRRVQQRGADAINDCTRDVATWRRVCCNAVSPSTMNAPIDFVLGWAAARGAWGRAARSVGGACRSSTWLRWWWRTVQRPATRD